MMGPEMFDIFLDVEFKHRLAIVYHADRQTNPELSSHLGAYW